MIKKIFSLLNLPKLKTVAMAIIVIVAAFVTGRLIGWGEGKDIAHKKQEKRKSEIEKRAKKNIQLFNRLSRPKRIKWLRRPRDRQ